MPDVALPQLVVGSKQVALADGRRLVVRRPSHASSASSGSPGPTARRRPRSSRSPRSRRRGCRAASSAPSRRRSGRPATATRSTSRRPAPRSSSGRCGRCVAAGDRGRGRRDHVARARRWTGSAAIAYDVAILTNVTHEHLEFHGTWEAYRDAKLSLFERLASGRGTRARRWTAALAKVGIVNARRPIGGAVRRRRAGSRRPRAHLRHGRAMPTSVRPGSRRTPAAARRLHRAERRRARWSSALPAGSTCTTRSRSSRWGGPRPAPCRPLGSRVGRAACPAAWSESTPASPSAWSSTTRTRRPRSRRSWASSRRSPRRAAAG